MLLAIDTATQVVSVALHDGHQILAEHTWLSPNQHTRQIPPAVRDVLRDSGVTASALTAVAIASGPGSYTALRIGMSLAKGIAGANGLPLVGVSTFDILAYSAPQLTGALIAVILAGRSRISVARYYWRKGWKVRGEAENMTWEALLASIDGAVTFTGEIDTAGLAQIDEARKNSETPITIMPGTLRLRRAGVLAEIAWARLSDPEADSETFKPQAVVPVYIQTKDSPA